MPADDVRPRGSVADIAAHFQEDPSRQAAPDFGGAALWPHRLP